MEPTPLNIFLVDDEPFCLEIYAQHLNNLGFNTIQQFSQSTDCLNQLTLKPDLIFLDYNMDNLNGIDILKKIKRFDPNIIVVFISGQEEIGIAVNALKYGAMDYLIKETLDEVKIGACLDKVMQLREMLKSKNSRGLVKKFMAKIGSIATFCLLSILFF